jgi:hypothetical protein
MIEEDYDLDDLEEASKEETNKGNLEEEIEKWKKKNESIKRKREEDEEEENMVTKKSKIEEIVEEEEENKVNVIIPYHSQWFKFQEIHETEIRAFPEFFDNKSRTRTAKL